MKELICVKDIIRDYPVPTAPDGVIHVLKGLNFSVAENEFVGIMGKSGGGKTTLLKLLGLIDTPTRGEILLNGVSVRDLWEEELSDLRRRKLGFVFQDFYLMDSLTVEENIMLPMILDKKNEADCIAGAALYAEQFEISHLLKKYPYEISGGEKQRTAICRALIHQPDLILADEPTGNLDSLSGKIVVDALEHIHKDLKKTIIMVTHDPEVASHCDRILFLKDGMILEDARKTSTTEVFYSYILNKMSSL